MTYASLDQLAARYTTRMLIDLTDRSDPPAGVVDEAVINREMASSDAVIDGHLAGRYRLPLAESPPLLADLAAIITIYKLHPFDPDPKITRDYTEALRTLRDIASGAVRLPLAGVEPDSRAGVGVKTTDRERPFSNENLTGFV
ncbi:MAG: gp436 family protein [Sphingomonadaceae bacterium]